MLTAIEIENFKAFGERQRIELRPITLLFGPNSGGKSSVTHALHYLRELMVDGNVDAHRTWSGGEALDFGGVRSLVNGRRSGPAMRFRLYFRLNGKDLPEFSGRSVKKDAQFRRFERRIRKRVRSASVEYEVATQGRAHISRISVCIDGRPIGDLVLPPDAPHAILENLKLGHAPLPEVESSAFGDLSEGFIVEDDDDDDAGTFVSDLGSIDGEDTAPASDLDVEADVESELERTQDDSTLSEYFVGEPDTEPDAGDAPERPDDFEPQFGESDDDTYDVEDEPNTPMLHWLYIMAGGSPSQLDALQLTRQPGGPTSWKQALAIEWPTADRRKDQDRRAEQFEALLTLLLLGPIQIAAQLMEQFRHVGPIRSIPPRHSEQLGKAALSRWSTGAQAWHALAFGDEQQIREVSDWLERDDRLDTGYRLERHSYRELPTSIAIRLADAEQASEAAAFADAIGALPDVRQLVFRDVERNLQLHPIDVGVGLSQIVPVVVACLSREAPLLALEQPELHLHPKQQAALGDVLIAATKANPQRVLLVETHSEHLILRILRRIRETTRGMASKIHELSPEQVRVQYVRREGSVSRVQAIDVDVQGDLVDPWPDDFFEQDFKERFA